MPDNRICRRRILSEEYRDFIVSSRRIPPDISVPEEQLCRQTTEAGYDVVYVEQSQAEPLEFGRFTYGSVPRCYALLDMAAMEQAGVTAVQNYPDPGTDGGTGDDRVRGHRDRLHPPPAFRNLDGSTRIEGLWDQTQQDGDPPEGSPTGPGTAGRRSTGRLRPGIRTRSCQAGTRTGTAPTLPAWPPAARGRRNSSWGRPRRL